MVTTAAPNFIGDHYFVSDFTGLQRDTLIADGKLCCYGRAEVSFSFGAMANASYS